MTKVHPYLNHFDVSLRRYLPNVSLHSVPGNLHTQAAAADVALLHYIPSGTHLSQNFSSNVRTTSLCSLVAARTTLVLSTHCSTSSPLPSSPISPYALTKYPQTAPPM